VTGPTGPTGVGTGGGLWANQLSTLPTQANTGLNTWYNQLTATVADTAAGVTITAPKTASSQVQGFYKTVPATPYSITALIALLGNSTTPNLNVGLGWTDGTKVHVGVYVLAASGSFVVSKWTSATTSSGSDANTDSNALPPLCWHKIRDDGTNVSFSFSWDGVNFYTYFSIAKASGFLTGTGYTYVGIFFNANGADTGTGSATNHVLMTIMSWTVGT
jgi:hypothetical protein